MYKCNCGKEFGKKRSLTVHARFCHLYIKDEKKKLEEYVCECGKEFEKAQSLNSHYSHCLVHRNGIPASKRGTGWHISPEVHQKQGKTYSENIKNGKTVPSFRGKHHSLESRQQISNSSSERNNGMIKCKYFDVYCPYENRNVKVQGTWEKKFAEILNEKNIKWKKDRTYSLKYIFDGLEKNYFPDFFLPERNEYIEIKGHWFKSPDGRVDDKRKMRLVAENNPTLTIRILDSMKLIEDFE